MRSRVLVPAAAGLVVVVGLGGYAVAAASTAGPAYRTAAARTGTVTRTLDLAGTVAASGVREIGFGVAGTVRSVRVHAGARVEAGDVLARLSTTSLQAHLDQAEASLAKAQAQLAADEKAQADTVTAAATTPTKTPTKSPTKTPTAKPSSKPTTPSTSPGVPAATLAALKTQQQDVVRAQQAATGAIGAAKTALDAQADACKEATQPGSGTSPSPSEDPSDSPSGSPTSTPTDPAGGDPNADCVAALQRVQQAQATVADDQQKLQSALEALSGTLTKAVAALQYAASQGTGSGTGGQGTGGQGAANQGSSNQGSSNQGSSTQGASDQQGGQPSGGRTVTAATLAQDQVGIESARADVVTARAARDAAVLRAPSDGQVLSVSASKGDAVGSSDSVLTLRSEGVTTVTTTVTTGQLSQLKVGQRATVTPAGWTSALDATVTRVGPLPDSDTYPVTLAVDTNRVVPEGTTAAVAVVTGRTGSTVTVPTSAVTRQGSRASVQVLSNDTVSTRSVTVGVVGPTTTSITSGIKSGERVVLATLDLPLPSSTTGTTTRIGGLTGGAPGGFRGPPGAR